MKMFEAAKSFIFGKDWQKIANLAINDAGRKIGDLSARDGVILDKNLKTILQETLAKELKKQAANFTISVTDEDLTKFLAGKISSALLTNRVIFSNTGPSAQAEISKVLQNIAESAPMAISPSAPPAEPHHYLPPLPSAPPAESHHYLPPLPSAPPAEPHHYLPPLPSAPPAMQPSLDPQPVDYSAPLSSAPLAEVRTASPPPNDRSSLDPQSAEPAAIRKQLIEATPSSITASSGIGMQPKTDEMTKK